VRPPSNSAADQSANSPSREKTCNGAHKLEWEIGNAAAAPKKQQGELDALESELQVPDAGKAYAIVSAAWENEISQRDDTMPPNLRLKANGPAGRLTLLSDDLMSENYAMAQVFLRLGIRPASHQR
jgi:hypothetical protein